MKAYKKGILAAVMSIGMGIGLAGTATAGGYCEQEYNSCVTAGVSESTCARLYNKCVRFGWGS